VVAVEELLEVDLVVAAGAKELVDVVMLILPMAAHAMAASHKAILTLYISQWLMSQGRWWARRWSRWLRRQGWLWS